MGMEAHDHVDIDKNTIEQENTFKCFAIIIYRTLRSNDHVD